MNEGEYHKLRETSWQRPLSPEEQSQLDTWLESHPESRAEWEEDVSLNALLRDTPDVPLASNFTSQTMQRVDRWEKERDRRARLDRSGWRRLFRWIPQAAAGIVVIAFAVSGYHILHEKQQRDAFAPGVALAKTMATLPNPDTLSDFNAIKHLSAVPHPVDFELLEALE